MSEDLVMLCARVPVETRDRVREAASIESLSIQDSIAGTLLDEAEYVIAGYSSEKEGEE